MLNRIRHIARLALCVAMAAMVPSSASATVPAEPLPYDFVVTKGQATQMAYGATGLPTEHPHHL